MNTFLPSPDFGTCARVLDNARLLRQIQEASWIANYLAKREDQGIAQGRNHPVFKLWKTAQGKPLLAHLYQYLKAMNAEYQVRYQVARDHASFGRCRWMPQEVQTKIIWADLVHASHRAKLLQKEKSHYTNTFKLFNLSRNTEPANYVWVHPEEKD